MVDWQNQLAVTFDSDEAVRVADAVIVRFYRRLVAFLLLDEGPNLVALYVLHRDVDDQSAHELLALLARLNQELHERVDVNAGDALRTP